MQIVYLDESGYTKDWLKGKDIQPYYVLSAVSFPSEALPQIYTDFRMEIRKHNLPGADLPLGLGYEVKAKNIANATGYWKENEPIRNAIRDYFLSAPKRYQGTAIVCIINKEKHAKKYFYPENPSSLALVYLIERIQLHLKAVDRKAICIYDQHDDSGDTQETVASLVREGSEVYYESPFTGQFTRNVNKINSILEFTSGESKNSIGLQIADFFATMTYAYLKGGKPEGCGWWKTLYESLYSKGNKVEGYGYKEFPK